VFQQDNRARKTADLFTMETPDYFSHGALATIQPSLKSGGPQSVVSNAMSGSTFTLTYIHF